MSRPPRHPARGCPATGSFVAPLKSASGATALILLVLALSAGPIERTEASGPVRTEFRSERSEPASTQAAVSDDWLSQARKRIRDAEYDVTWQTRTELAEFPAAWHAPNRAHGFRTYFTERGIRLIPRRESRTSEAGLSWVWGLELVGYGRGDRGRSVDAPLLSSAGNRIDYDRGGILEWYVNDPGGLRQEFKLAAPPGEAVGPLLAGPVAGREPEGDAAMGDRPGGETGPVAATGPDPSGRIFLDLEMTGTLSPSVASDSQSIDFVTHRGARVLRYAELRVTDARGGRLPSWMEAYAEAGARGIRIVVDDRDALYPITVDPIATSPDWSAEGGQTSAYFGDSVATAGDVDGDGFGDVIVGAYGFDNGQFNEGSAFLFYGSPSGLSSSPGWSAESDQSGAFFGDCVASAGDVDGDGFSDVIVGTGAWWNGVAKVGAAWLFMGSATGPAATSSWMLEGPQANASFGQSVATAGDVNGDGFSDVIVGSPGYSNGQAAEGAAFVFHGSASGLSSSDDWSAEGNQANSWFGVQAITAGDVDGDGYGDVIVGAARYDNGQIDEGRVYVYLGSGTGLAGSPAWTAESNRPNAEFGISVSTAGDLNGDGYADVIVGADRYSNGHASEGAAFVYLGSASLPSGTPDWQIESDQVGAYLGYAVAPAGDVNGDGYADLVVGAYLFDGDVVDEGGAFVYLGSPTGPGTAPAWTGTSDQGGSQYGAAVAPAGDVDGDGFSDIIIGGPRFDNGAVDEGGAWVYAGSPDDLSGSPDAHPPDADWTADGGQADVQFGSALASAGDVNGDGFGDLVVGAPNFDNGEYGEGRVFLFLGSATGLSASPAWTAEGDQASAFLGHSLAGAGDVDGDGYGDVVVGSHLFDNGEIDEGRALVYLGSPTGLAPSAAWTAEGNQPYSYFGGAVARAGDVNGDGFGDVAVGAYQYTDGESDEGAAFVYLGSSSGLPAVADWMAEGDQAGAWFGNVIDGVGDVNADGFSDLVVGANAYDNGEFNEGMAFLFLGTPTGLSPSAAWTAECDQVSCSYPSSVRPAGDVNGDGYSDVIVGAANYDVGPYTNAGRVFLYHGSAAGLAPTAAWAPEGSSSGDGFGSAAETAGDVNGDGYSDVIIGAGAAWNGELYEGMAYLYLGSASSPPLGPVWSLESDEPSAFLGADAAAGDFNGDGLSDIAVGAKFFDNGQTNEGAVFVFYGGGGGLGLAPRQLRADRSAPIGPLGASESPDSFRLAASGRSPSGRALARLEWEVKPLGTPLDGTGLQSGASWTDTGTAGTELQEVVSGLALDTPHHWRLRLLHHPATSPYHPWSRWLTGEWNAWEETDLRTTHRSDVSVTMSDAVDPILAGDDIVYTISVASAGPDATAVTLVDTLSPGVTFLSAIPSQGSCGESAGIVTCSMGTFADGDSATLTVTVNTPAPGLHVNRLAAFTSGTDPDRSDNTRLESTLVVEPAIGDLVWEDTDGNGIQDPNEPGIPDALVALYDGTGSLLTATTTDAGGAYSFGSLVFAGSYQVQFVTPPGFVPAIRDQGRDDTSDSDPDPVTGKTSIFSLLLAQDVSRWDAGMVPYCLPPDEPVYIYLTTLSTDGNSYPILHFMDANQLSQVTGYNVYRSSDPAPPPPGWPLVASDIIDMDQATPNHQWVDSTGDVSPTGIWYYEIAAYNHRCTAEGPF